MGGDDERVTSRINEAVTPLVGPENGSLVVVPDVLELSSATKTHGAEVECFLPAETPGLAILVPKHGSQAWRRLAMELAIRSMLGPSSTVVMKLAALGRIEIVSSGSPDVPNQRMFQRYAGGENVLDVAWASKTVGDKLHDPAMAIERLPPTDKRVDAVFVVDALQQMLERSDSERGKSVECLISFPGKAVGTDNQPIPSKVLEGLVVAAVGGEEYAKTPDKAMGLAMVECLLAIERGFAELDQTGIVPVDANKGNWHILFENDKAGIRFVGTDLGDVSFSDDTARAGVSRFFPGKWSYFPDSGGGSKTIAPAVSAFIGFGGVFFNYDREMRLYAGDRLLNTFAFSLVPSTRSFTELFNGGSRELGQYWEQIQGEVFMRGRLPNQMKRLVLDLYLDRVLADCSLLYDNSDVDGVSPYVQPIDRMDTKLTNWKERLTRQWDELGQPIGLEEVEKQVAGVVSQYEAIKARYERFRGVMITREVELSYGDIQVTALADRFGTVRGVKPVKEADIHSLQQRVSTVMRPGYLVGVAGLASFSRLNDGVMVIDLKRRQDDYSPLVRGLDVNCFLFAPGKEGDNYYYAVNILRRAPNVYLNEQICSLLGMCAWMSENKITVNDANLECFIENGLAGLLFDMKKHALAINPLLVKPGDVDAGGDVIFSTLARYYLQGIGVTKPDGNIASEEVLAKFDEKERAVVLGLVADLKTGLVTQKTIDAIKALTPAKDEESSVTDVAAQPAAELVHFTVKAAGFGFEVGDFDDTYLRSALRYFGGNSLVSTGEGEVGINGVLIVPAANLPDQARPSWKDRLLRRSPWSVGDYLVVLKLQATGEDGGTRLVHGVVVVPDKDTANQLYGVLRKSPTAIADFTKQAFGGELMVQGRQVTVLTDRKTRVYPNERWGGKLKEVVEFPKIIT